MTKFKAFMKWYWKLCKLSLVTQVKAYAIIILCLFLYGKYLEYKDRNVLVEK